MAQGVRRTPSMVTFLITSFLLLAGITYAAYLWQRPSSKEGAEALLPPPGAAGLFSEDPGEPAPRELSDGRNPGEDERRALLARAEAGDKEALDEARATEDAALYDEVLNILTERADSDKSLLALASYVARSDARLSVNRRLAERFIESYRRAPDRQTTMKMLHVAAGANDAGLYQTAVETAYQFWRDRRLTGTSADELRQLIEGEFWLLSPEARTSGAGFLLKRTLARLRKQLQSSDE